MNVGDRAGVRPLRAEELHLGTSQDGKLARSEVRVEFPGVTVLVGPSILVVLNQHSLRTVLTVYCSSIYAENSSTY